MKNSTIKVILVIIFAIACYLLTMHALLPIKEVQTSTPDVSMHAFFQQEKYCIKEALWYEARSEHELGIRAVAAVIENRKNTPGFPKSYCSVIWQYKQFSYRNHLKHGMIMPIGEDKRIDTIADEMVRGYFFSPIRENVLYYCTTKVKPYWIKDVKKVLVIDGHQFFERK